VAQQAVLCPVPILKVQTVQTLYLMQSQQPQVAVVVDFKQTEAQLALLVKQVALVVVLVFIFQVVTGSQVQLVLVLKVLMVELHTALLHNSAWVQVAVIQRLAVMEQQTLAVLAEQVQLTH
jgi:hypothetical protein